MAQVITLAGQTIKNPTKFSIENYALTRETGRLINGEMVMDHVALKKKYQVEYEAINGVDLKVITDIINTTTRFYTLTYKDYEGTQTKTVYAGAILYTQFRTDGYWTWTDCSFALIEK